MPKDLRDTGAPAALGFPPYQHRRRVKAAATVLLDHMKTGSEIRKDLRAIINSRPKNLVAELKDYIVRMRHDDLRADDEARWRLKLNKPRDRPVK